nr:hemagglutinin repeat-containing protein [uncultured Noviherbaspirillum sp.]
MLANGRLSILADGAVDNSGGSLQAVAGLTLTGRSLANAGGLVASDGNVSVQADAGVASRHGTLSAGGSLEVLARSGMVDNSAGKMLAADGVTVASGRLVNDGGSIAANGEQGGALTVDANALSNRQGTMAAAAALALTSAGAVDNTGGAMLAATGAAHITSDSLDNAGGRIISRDALAIVTGALDNANAGTIASSAGTVAIDAARIGNLGGKMTGAGAVTVNSLAFDNSRGELSSGTDLHLDTHGQALTNRDGTLLGMGKLTLRAGAIDSSAQAGETRIVAGGSLDIVADSLANDRGLISGAQGATVALGSGLLRNQGGTIESGAALTLAAGMLVGQGGHIGATDTVTITAATVNVADGSIDAGKAIDITSAGVIDNSRGNIISDGKASLNAASLINAGGVASAVQGADVRLGAGYFDNSAGSLLGGAALTVQSGEIHNAVGTISTASALTLDTGNRLLDNSDGGQILSGGTLVLKSGRFVNQDGTAASTESELQVTTNGQALDNERGKLQAKKDVTLATGALTNRDGLVSGQRLVIGTSTLDNDRGKVLAEGALDVDSRAADGVLNNDRGLLQAGGALTIAIGAQTLVNAASGDAAGIVAGGKLNVTAGSLDNRAGFIGSKDSQVVTLSGDLDNQVLAGKGGRIASNAGSTIRAGRVFNQGGRIDALGDAAVTAGLLDNGGGAIAANRTVTLDVGTLDNRARNGVAASIDGAGITATATVIDNRGGAMRAAGDATLTAASLDNRGGDLNAAGVLRVTSATLVNDGGSLVGDGGVVVTTSSQSPGGAIASQRDVTLNIQGDYTNTGLLSAQKNLTVNAANITNSGALTAGDTLTANTGNLDNSGEISASTTLLKLSGTLTNTVTGLVNGGNTRINAAKVDNAGRIYGDLLRIDAGTLVNRGTGVLAARNTLLAGVKDLSNTEGGLIYSLGELGVGGAFDPTGKLQGAAQSLLNASSRIEAAGRMAIFADSVVNRNDAISTRLVTGAPVASEFVQPRNSPSRYPLGQCFGIGGGQGNNTCIVHPEKYGLRSVVTPVYSQFISSYDLFTSEPVYATSTNYTWDSPIFTQYHVAVTSNAPPAEPASGCASVDQVTGASTLLDTPQCRRWATDREAWNIAFSESLTELDGKVNAYNASVNEDNRLDIFEDYTWYKVNSTSTSTEIVSSAPGQILSGDGMLLSGSVTNRDSQIVAGGVLTVVGPDVRNIATQGMTHVEQQGTSMFTERVASGALGTSAKREFGRLLPYNPAPVVTMTDLPTVRFETLVGRQTSVRDLDVVTQGADSSTAGNAQAASRGRDTVSTVGIDAVMSNGPTARTLRPAVPVVQRVAASGTGLRANDVILTTPPVLTIPASALFVLHPEPASRTLVETDPRFTNYRSFISSDYFQQVLKRDPEQQLKRYGDGFLEQQLVNDQVLALTGRRYLDGYTSTEAEYMALMDAGVAYARQYQFSPGIALSAEQMALLTTDIVWLETRSVTLADGSSQQVTVPQVYLRRPVGGDLQPNGALMAGSDVQIRAERDLVNSGSIAGKSIDLDASRDLLNDGGRISGQDIWMRASNDLKNLSGVVTAAGPAARITLLAGRDIVLQTQALGSAGSDGNSSRVNVQRVATVQGGDIRLDAGRDLRVDGATVAADGRLDATAVRDIRVTTVAGQYQLDEKDGSGRSVQGRTAHVSEAATTNQGSALLAGGDLSARAGRDVLLKGATVDAAAGDVLIEGRNVRNVRIDAAIDRVAVDVQAIGRKSYDRTARDSETLLSSAVTAANNVTVRASGGTEPGAGNITIIGSVVTARNGEARLDASNDITIGNAVTRQRAIDQSYSKSGNLLSTTTTTRASDLRVQQAEGSVVSGNTVVARAGHDLTVQGSAVVGEGDVTLDAVNNLSIRAATSTSSRKASSTVVEQGFLDSDAVVSYGERTTTTNIDETSSTQSGQQRSLVVSGKGNLAVTAARALSITGSNLAGGQDVLVQGLSTYIDPGRDKSESRVDTRMTQDALSLSVGGTVVNAMQTIQGLGEAAGKTSNTRMQAMAAATAALAAANLARDIATNGVNISVSITGGHTESRKTETHSLDTGSGSSIAAGRDLAVIATGGGKDSNIDAVGSDLRAKNNVVIRADNKVNLGSSQDLEEQHSSSRSMSAAAGVGVSVGTKGSAIGVAGSVSAGRAQEDGSGVTQRNTHVTGGNSVTVVSGGDANLKGAVIAGGKVTADIGGDLNIESRQDTAKFDSKSQSASVSGVAGWGASVSASFNQSKVGSDYASVQEQSGIRAGDGGFDVRVKGNTDLKGGVISSTQAGVDNNRNKLVTTTLTQSDVENHADYRGESFGVSGGVSSGGGDGKDPSATGAGKGPGGSNLINVASTSGAGLGAPVAAFTSGSKDSVTRSGISGGSIVITDDAAQQAATGKSAAETVAATNRAIVSAFVKQASPLAANMVGDFSSKQQARAQQEADGYAQQADAARRAGDATGAAAYDDRARQSQATADNWSDNGVYRLALHAGTQAAVGGVAGGAGMAAAAAGGTVGGSIGQQLGKGLGEQEADRRGLTGMERAAFVNSYQQGLATVGGVVGGAVAGGGTAVAGAQGGGVAAAVDVFNRQLHISNYERLKDGCRGSSSAECQTINRMGGVRSGMPVVDAKIPASKVVENYDASGKVVSYTLINSVTNQPTMIMEPLEFDTFRNAAPGIQAMMQLSPQYALDFASAGLYSAAGDNGRALEHVGAGVTSRDYVRDVGLGVAGAAVSAASVAKPNLNPSGLQPSNQPGSATRGTPDLLQPEADFAGRGTIRVDLTDHLVKPQISGKQISGGHDMNEFTMLLNKAGGTVVSKVEAGPGIYEIQYQLPNSNKPAVKTVFDPVQYPNMENMVNTAANRGLMEYQLTGNAAPVVQVNGINFDIRIAVRPGEPPSVRTAFPVGSAK